MAFYDRYTGKRFDPRQVLRDDERTRRPKREKELMREIGDPASADRKPHPAQKHAGKLEKGRQQGQSEFRQSRHSEDRGRERYVDPNKDHGGYSHNRGGGASKNSSHRQQHPGEWNDDQGMNGKRESEYREYEHRQQDIKGKDHSKHASGKQFREGRHSGESFPQQENQKRPEKRQMSEKNETSGRPKQDGTREKKSTRHTARTSEEKKEVAEVITPPEAPHDPELDAGNVLAGRNPIREALKANRDMEKLLVAKGELMGSAREILSMARDQHVVIQEVERARLDAIAPNHQGMIAIVSAYQYKTMDDIFELAASKKEDPFIVVLDGITDPHNLGAIIRSAECAGAHGVIIPTRRAAGLTPAAVKASAGAVEHIPIVREVNLSRTIEKLKKEGAWVFGSTIGGKNYRNADYSGPVVLVVGSEGDGISKLVADHCDDMISIPTRGNIQSLNASVAAGIILFAIAEKRGGK